MVGRRPRRRARGAGTSGYFAPPLPRLIAHRGLALEHAENTLDAFQAALDAGATHLETDVQVTRDGEVVVLHDDDLSRVLGSTLTLPLVSSLTLAELRRSAGRQVSICTLSELLQTFPSALLNIDVKAHGGAAEAGRIIAATAAEDRVLLASFSDRRRRAALRGAPSAATSPAGITVLVAVLAARLGFQLILNALLRQVDALQIPESVARIRTSAPGTIARFHAAGVEVHVWTINDPADMRRLLDAGADGIVTDRVDILRRVVDEWRGVTSSPQP